MKTEEYNLEEAGAFNEKDLLQFKYSENAKGLEVKKIWITKLQANHLANSIKGVTPEKTGFKLVDFWNEPRQPVELKSVHGIEIAVENDF